MESIVQSVNKGCFIKKTQNMIYLYDLKDQQIIDYMVKNSQEFEKAANVYISQFKTDNPDINQEPVISKNGVDTLIYNDKTVITQSETADCRYFYLLLSPMYNINVNTWYDQTQKSIIGRNLSLKLIDFLLECNKIVNLSKIKVHKTEQQKKNVVQWLNESKYSIINGQSRFINCVNNYQLAISYKSSYIFDINPSIVYLLILNYKTNNSLDNAILMICDVIQILISYFHTTPFDNITYNLCKGSIISINMNDIFDFSIMSQVIKHLDAIIDQIKTLNNQQTLYHIYAITGLVRINNELQIEKDLLDLQYNYVDDNQLNCQLLFKSYPYMFRPRDQKTHQLIVDNFDISDYKGQVDEEQQYYTLMIVEGNNFRQGKLNIQQLYSDELREQDTNQYTQLYDLIKETVKQNENSQILKCLIANIENESYSWISAQRMLNDFPVIQQMILDMNLIQYKEIKENIVRYNEQKRIKGIQPITYSLFDLNRNVYQQEQTVPDDIQDKAKELIDQMYLDKNKDYIQCVDHSKVYCIDCYKQRCILD